MVWAIADKHYSQRRACRLVGLDRKSFRYVLQVSRANLDRRGLLIFQCLDWIVALRAFRAVR